MSEENRQSSDEPWGPMPPIPHISGGQSALEQEPDDGLTDFEINPVIPRQYFYNLRTGQVEEGPLSSWTQRMGPYPTPEDAYAALEKARDRDRAWEAADDEWYGRTHEEDD